MNDVRCPTKVIEPGDDPPHLDHDGKELLGIIVPLFHLSISSISGLISKMKSLWGQKKDDPARLEESSRGHNEDSGNAPVRAYHEPTERTRLLPPENNQGYLSPDDPAVCSSSHSSCLYRRAKNDHLGISVQSMERACFAGTVPASSGSELCVVDVPFSVHLRQPTAPAFAGLRFLRILVYHISHGIFGSRLALLLRAVQAHDNMGQHPDRLPCGGHDHHRGCAASST